MDTQIKTIKRTLEQRENQEQTICRNFIQWNVSTVAMLIKQMDQIFGKENVRDVRVENHNVKSALTFYYLPYRSYPANLLPYNELARAYKYCVSHHQPRVQIQHISCPFDILRCGSGNARKRVIAPHLLPFVDPQRMVGQKLHALHVLKR